MRGLLYKECKMFEPQIKSWIFVILVLLAASLFSRSAGGFMGGIAAMGITNAFTQFTLDRQYRCQDCIPAMAVTRRQIVSARYLFVFLTDLAVGLVMLLLTCLLHGNLGIDTPFEALTAFLAVFLITVLMQLILLPLVYFLGEEKARILFIAMFALLFFFCWWLFSVGNAFLGKVFAEGGTAEERLLIWALAGLAVADAALSLPSYLVSAARFERQEL